MLAEGGEKVWLRKKNGKKRKIRKKRKRKKSGKRPANTRLHEGDVAYTGTRVKTSLMLPLLSQKLFLSSM